jgi:hypothetical protein
MKLERLSQAQHVGLFQYWSKQVIWEKISEI